MTASAPLLLQELHRLDVRVCPHGDQLEIDAPAGVLTESLEANIVRHKRELLRLTAPGARLDPDLSAREVLSFPAHWLSELPLPTTLVLDMPGRGCVTLATHPRCARTDLDVSEWRAWCASDRSRTVADVLASRSATLRLVVIEGGA